jgi:hypothetical protein
VAERRVEICRGVAFAHLRARVASPSGPADHREKATWRYIADRVNNAACGVPLMDLAVLPFMVVTVTLRVVNFGQTQI